MYEELFDRKIESIKKQDSIVFLYLLTAFKVIILLQSVIKQKITRPLFGAVMII